MPLEHPAAGQLWHAPLHTLAPDPQPPEPELRDWEEVAGTIDPAAYLESLDRELDRLERQGDDKIVARRFFSELDREANPILLQGMVRLGRIHREDADQRRITIKIVSNELRECLRFRMEWPDGESGSRAKPIERLTEQFEARCRYVSTLVLGLIDGYFGGDLTAFERALQQFASGELRVALPGCLATVQPSSDNFLLFEELARIASRYDMTCSRWHSILLVLARARPTFICAYAFSANAARRQLSARATTLAHREQAPTSTLDRKQGRA